MTSASELGAYLKEQGYRVTPQRLLILQTVQDSDRHLSVEEIHDRVAAVFPYLDISTVYRTVERFTSMGLLHKTDLGEDHAHYEWSDDGHQHMVCTSCGKVEHFSGELVLPLLSSLDSQHGFAANSATMAVFGLCRNCRSKGG
jgi:Fur family ferric uptake transcriptional regulator